VIVIARKLERLIGRRLIADRGVAELTCRIAWSGRATRDGLVAEIGLPPGVEDRESLEEAFAART